jgi:hypothetical protein
MSPARTADPIPSATAGPIILVVPFHENSAQADPSRVP